MARTKRLLRRADRDAKRMRRTVMYSKPETKYFNQTISETAISTTVDTCNVPAGTDIEERIGRKIRLKSVEYMGRLTLNDIVRVILYVPKDQGEVLSIPSTTAAVENDRFWILHDKLYDPNGSSTVFQYRHTFPMGMLVEFGGPLGTDINRNGVKMLVQSGDSVARAFHTKIWYQDN